MEFLIIIFVAAIIYIGISAIRNENSAEDRVHSGEWQ